MTNCEPRDERRARIARLLTEETGIKVDAHKHCWSVWDEAIGYAWFPIGGTEGVRAKIAQIKSRSPEETRRQKDRVTWAS